MSKEHKISEQTSLYPFPARQYYIWQFSWTE